MHDRATRVHRLTEPVKRAVLTLALGKPIYLDMAINLARSFFWWHNGSEIQFFIATDQRRLLPRDLPRVSIINILPGQYGSGFSPKLHLDKIALADQTLFVDADCLCVREI